MPSLVKSSDNEPITTDLFVSLEEKIDRIMARGESTSHSQANQPWRGDLLKHANAFVKALGSYENNNRTACTSLEGQALRQITDCTIDEIKHRLEKCKTSFHPTDDLKCLGVSVVCDPTPLHSHTTECPAHSYELTLQINISLPSIRYIADEDDETAAPIPISTTSGFTQHRLFASQLTHTPSALAIKHPICTRSSQQNSPSQTAKPKATTYRSNPSQTKDTQ